MLIFKHDFLDNMCGCYKIIPTLFILLLVIHPEASLGQEADSATPLVNTIQNPPSPDEGMDGFRQYIARNYRYSRKMSRNKVRGRLEATFVVERDGSLGDFVITKDLGHGTAEEFIRVLKKYASRHTWNPGYQDGRAVRVQYSIPIFISD
ncbi:MAG TPA: energy transducer TonB [Sphingobacterium sp.]|nr:energy transducer TonB [Sphingobacterium sp.]